MIRKLVVFSTAFSLFACSTSTPRVPNSTSGIPDNTVDVRAWVNQLGHMTPPSFPAPTPIRTYNSNNGSPQICMAEKATKTAPEANPVIYNNTQNVFPASLIQAQTTISGVPATVGVNGRSGTLTITDFSVVGKQQSVRVDEPTMANILEARKNLLRQGGFSAAKVSYSADATDSLEETLFAAGVSANWLGGGVQASLIQKTKSAKSVGYMRFYQAYYTANWQPDDNFPVARQVSISDIRTHSPLLGSGNPPVLVSSVTYGREMLILVASDKSSTDLSAALQAAQGAILGSADLKVSAAARWEVDHSQMEIVALGGSPEDAARVIVGAGDGQMGNMGKIMTGYRDYIKEGLRFSVDKTPEIPLSYKVDYFDNTTMQLILSTDFTTKPMCSYIPFEDVRMMAWTGKEEKPKRVSIHLRLMNSDKTSVVEDGNPGGGIPWPSWSNQNGPWYLAIKSSFDTHQCRDAIVELFQDGDDQREDLPVRVELWGHVDIKGEKQDRRIFDSGMVSLRRGSVYRHVAGCNISLD